MQLVSEEEYKSFSFTMIIDFYVPFLGGGAYKSFI